MLDACPRRYLFHYYVSWGGWRAQAPAVVREAFKLKRLVTLPLWRGQLIHYVATMVLRSMRARGRIPARDDVVRYTLERFDAQLAFSRERRYLTAPKTRGGKLDIDWLALFDHEYGKPPTAERIERSKLECVRCVDGLLNGPLLGEIMATDPGSWLIEDLDRAEFSQTFTFGGVTVYAKTDLLYRDADGLLNIVDWKTGSGESRGIDLQFGIYGYWAAKKLGEPIDSIRLREVRLAAGGDVRDRSIDEKSLERFYGRIEAGIARLADLLVDRDTGRNEARPPREFPTIDADDVCERCNFFRICKDPSSRLCFPCE